MKAALFVIALSLGLATATGCKGEPEVNETFVRICKSSSADLASGKVPTDKVALNLSNTVRACGGACDQGHGESCSQLDTTLTKLCKVSSSVCEKLCDPANEGAVSKKSCALSKK